MRGQFPGVLGSLEVGVGGIRLARITELAEAQLLGRHAIRQRHEREVDGGSAGGRRSRLKERVAPQQGKLPRDPHAPSSRFAVGYALEAIAENSANGCK